MCLSLDMLHHTNTSSCQSLRLINSKNIKIHTPWVIPYIPLFLYSYLDVSLPVVLGRVHNETGRLTHTSKSFTGCLRYVIINGKHQDFSKALLQSGTGTGCEYTDRNCGNNTCNNRGVCLGHWTTEEEEGEEKVFECVCPTSHRGTTCDEGKHVHRLAS